MKGGELPGTTEGGAARIVCHVDMDCFYASCERLREPSLCGEPVVVGMGYERGESIGAVATASYEAREYGVESAQAISQALERLPRVAGADEDGGTDGNAGGGTNGGDRPRGHYRPVDLDFYESVASEVKAVLHDCAETVREVSIDEAYLDVTDRTGWDVVDGRTLAAGYARHVKERIAAEVGVPASVGVAPNMSTAKVASDHDKPDGLVVVPPGEVRSFLAPLPVSEIHGVGPVTARELAGMGVETAGDLATADPATLRDAFGERGVALRRRARGDDDRAVTPTGKPKSLSRESAFAEASDDEDRKRERVRGLAADVADRASRRGATYRTIGIKVVEPPYDVSTRAQSLPGPVDDLELVEGVALELLSEFDGAAVRKLGVRVSNLSFAAGEQARLDGWQERADASGGERADATGGEPTEASPDDETTLDDETTAEGDDGSDRGARDLRGQVSLGDFGSQ